MGKEWVYKGAELSTIGVLDSSVPHTATHQLARIGVQGTLR